MIAIDKPDSSKELSVLQSIFRRDFYRNQLESELYLIPATFKKHISISFCDICKTFQDMDEEKRPIIKTIWTITWIALTRDAISATLKGFFFSMQRRTKTWLRSTMGRKRYNSLSVLNAHTNILDNLSLIEVAEQFANIITGTQTNLGHLLKKIFMNIFSFFFMFFKKLGQSWTNILILVCIFKRLWAVLKNSRA